MGQTLGAYLRDCREKRNISQKDLSDRLGLVSPQFISNIERGRAGLPLARARTYCEIVNASPLILRNIMQAEYWENLSHLLLLPEQLEPPTATDGQIWPPPQPEEQSKNCPIIPIKKKELP